MREELKAAFAGKGFAIAFTVMFACICLRIVPDWISTADWGEYRPDALHLVIGSIFFGGVMIILPFCATIPHAMSQAEEIQTSFVFWKAMRSSVRRISFQKALATMLSGGFAVMLAFVINVLIWNMIAVPIDPIAFPAHVQQFYDGVLYNEWYGVMYGIPMYTSMSLGIFLCGSLWSLVGLAVSAWMPDKLLVVTIPVGIYFLWMYNLPKWLLGIDIPPPSALFNDGLTLQVMIQALIVNGIAFAVAGALYVIGMERRIQHG